MRATVEGLLLTAPRGRSGFGYDPLFFYPAAGRTFAEMARAAKNRVSHRGRALEAIVRFLRAHRRGQEQLERMRTGGV